VPTNVPDSTNASTAAFDIRDTVENPAIERNQRSFAANGMWAALNSARPSPGFPKDVAVHIYEQGLTHADAVSMSSVDRAAWDARRR
jgi:hypothetical protein